jgi:hypothetical protein
MISTFGKTIIMATVGGAIASLSVYAMHKVDMKALEEVEACYENEIKWLKRNEEFHIEKLRKYEQRLKDLGETL